MTTDDEKRTGYTAPIYALLPDYATAVKRMTGWSLEEWADIYRDRRRRGFARITSDRWLTMTELDRFVRAYGFDEPDDFIAVLCPGVGLRWRLNPEKYPL